jgi:hypothetical protein
MKNDFSDEFGGVNFIDLGCSGGLDPRWAPFERFINYTGFDSRKDACEELQSKNGLIEQLNFCPMQLLGRIKKCLFILLSRHFALHYENLICHGLKDSHSMQALISKILKK